uniref:Uncharacterized protein n=1 Tax=Arundo donax TaxID=35708 RepID=A0A0A9EI74_ARUDO
MYRCFWFLYGSKLLLQISWSLLLYCIDAVEPLQLLVLHFPMLFLSSLFPTVY